MSSSTTTTGEKRKKVDPRIRTLLENNAKTGHRSFLVMIGDKGKEQVANLHYMLTKAQVAKRPTVLWCFKKELEFSSHRKKRMKQLKKASKGLKRENDGARLEDDPFELFLTSTQITYCYYGETERILGNTFGMCILQDFEALTPNLLARTIETVQGGGLVVLLLKTLTSLKQLYTMTMDVHARYRTESQQHDPVARFNERFLLSLPGCSNCLIVNDQLDVMPVTGMAAREIQPVKGTVEAQEQRSLELERVKADAVAVGKQGPVSKLVECAKTVDQAKTVKEMADLLQTQPLRTTVSLTAGRGRGKSAAVGLALAAALQAGYANIFLTSPSPENLKTVFEFLFKGLDALGYEEHLDYDVVQSTQVELAKCIVRVNVHRQGQHRQTVLYILPEDAHLLGQAELVAIDEAAAIPLPLVQALTSGPQTVILSSTINGYEGTGRSLSLKLLAELRKPGSSRSLREFTLEEPIRYAPADPVEGWLNKLLCLDVVNATVKLASALPHPDSCQLYLISRDTLFSYHKAAEAFLQRLLTLYVSSHYKNSPNDLQLMSDAPGHMLFVLLPPGAEAPAHGGLPDILCFVQVCLEGHLSKQSILNSLQRGKRAAGDLIPWNVSQQFQDDDFAQLSGARVVRIAVNPECQRMGYGSRALRLLERFFMGELLSVEDPISCEDYSPPTGNTLPSTATAAPSTEELKPRTNLKPLMTRADQVKPILLHWLGVSFGLTGELWRFYKREHYRPVYLRQTTNDITGEHTMIVLKQLLISVGDVTCSGRWLSDFNADFTRRFLNLLSFTYFAKLPTSVCLSICESHAASQCGSGSGTSGTSGASGATNANSSTNKPSPFDLKRLEAYAQNLLDYHMITDLLPDLTRTIFTNTIPLTLSPVQSAILLAMGMQRKTVEMVSAELGLPVSQVLAMFCKAIRRFVSFNKEGQIQQLMAESPEPEAPKADGKMTKKYEPVATTLEDELDSAGDEAARKLKRKQRQLIDSLDLTRYEIAGDEQEWSKELTRKSANLEKVTVSIKNKADGVAGVAGVDVAKTLYKKHVVEPAEQKAKAKRLKH